MNKLVMELLERNWEFEVYRDAQDNYCLMMALGNQYRYVHDDYEALDLYEEIRKHW